MEKGTGILAGEISNTENIFHGKRMVNPFFCRILAGNIPRCNKWSKSVFTNCAYTSATKEQICLTTAVDAGRCTSHHEEKCSWIWSSGFACRHTYLCFSKTEMQPVSVLWGTSGVSFCLLSCDKSKGCAAGLQRRHAGQTFSGLNNKLWNKKQLLQWTRVGTNSNRGCCLWRAGGSLLPSPSLDVSRKLWCLTQLCNSKRWHVASQPSFRCLGDMPVLLSSGQEGKSFYSTLLFVG